MKGLSEQDAELSSAKRVLNDTEFSMFEFQMAQNRVRDLEAQLDKLLESTLNQRQRIEDFEKSVSDLTNENAQLSASEKDKIEKIFELSNVKRNLENDLKYMTGQRDELQTEKEEVSTTLQRKEVKINELETRVY